MNTARRRRQARFGKWAGLVCGSASLWAIAGTALTNPAAEPDKLYFETAAVPGADYRVARYEVTQAQYEEITGENPSASSEPRAPVDSVSWEDAEAFCARLTAREQKAGRLPPD